MKKIELFVQGEGIKDIVMIEVPVEGSIRDILLAVKASGHSFEDEAQIAVFLEEEEHSFDLDQSLDEAGIHHRKSIHLHRCHHVEVSVNFNGQAKQEEFPPSATIKRVKKWATGPQGFDLSDLDASEHALHVNRH